MVRKLEKCLKNECVIFISARLCLWLEHRSTARESRDGKRRTNVICEKQYEHYEKTKV